MSKTQLKHPFTPLKELNLTSMPFYLSTRGYEMEMSRGMGLPDIGNPDLKTLISEMACDGSYRQHRKRLIELVPYYWGFYPLNPSVPKRILDEYTTKTPCAMSLDDLRQLEIATLMTYQVMYANYVISSGRHNKFPIDFCGNSARNVVFSLFMFGFPNASVVNNNHIRGDHSFVALPFMIPSLDLNGIIFADPTSDQFSNNDIDNIRNSICVTSIDELVYMMQYAGDEVELVPTRFLHSGSFEGIVKRERIACERGGDCELNAGGYWSKSSEFVGEAFSNPIKVEGVSMYIE